MDIKTYLQKKNINQKTFGNQCGVCQQSISHYATGRRRPSIKTAKKIAAASGGKISIKTLLGI
jgi:transcriptional regulator with XRE-family HTH domain